MIPPEVLGGALRTGVMPADFEPHIGALLDKAPLPLLGSVAAQTSSDAAPAADQVWSQELVTQLKITRETGAPAMRKGTAGHGFARRRVWPPVGAQPLGD
ncbi:hypothetical protein OOZ63_27140 [Paucibacter sp. PLA-PC-4]|uniref:hypothetical protein n=1 Tax=Paucibacter sp. PLA-PC-4 TaxID=2993655 RepID=UPI00224AB14F|nr:hypothetical protein [Paucibacter sp. PLA-PC-4]MCX2865503.1 hypothetical protein [Paucibacter sp. PLA-PC-4]